MGVSLITVINIIFVFTALVPDIQAVYVPQELNDGVCEKTVTRIVSHIVYVQRKRQQCTKTNCKTFNGSEACSQQTNEFDIDPCICDDVVLYFAVSETRYRTETTTVHVCCDGYIDVDGVCTRVDLTTGADGVSPPIAGDTDGLSGESDGMSTAMIVGLGSVIVISIIGAVVIIVVCVHRRKPKLNVLNKLRRGSSPQYSEDNDYTDGYLEPRKSKGLSAIGNALYRKGLFSMKKEPKRQSNIYTDLRAQTYANKVDSESHDYSMLQEPKPPISKLTSYFEGKNEDSSSAKSKLPPGRANTSPIRKKNNHNEQRINSTPLPKTKIKYTTNTDNISFPEIRLKKTNFETGKGKSNAYQPKAGVHSLINSFSAKDGQQIATKLSAKPNSVSSGYKVNKTPSKQHIPNLSGQNKRMNMSGNPKTSGHGTAYSTTPKRHGTAHSTTPEGHGTAHSTTPKGHGTAHSTTPKELQKPLVSKKDARTILMRTLGSKTASLPTTTEDPPEYEDINFYEDI